MTAGIEVGGLGEGMSFSHRDLEIAPGGPRTFRFTLGVGRNSPPGPREIAIRIVPRKPSGFEDRAVSLTIPVTIVPLSFWERYGRNIQIGVTALVGILLLLGLVIPSRFRRSAILHYEDRRDPDMPREAKFPLGAKARAGFYRSAKNHARPRWGPCARRVWLRFVRAQAGRYSRSRFLAVKQRNCRVKEALARRNPVSLCSSRGGFGLPRA
jgi:hypothetical protein